MPPRRPPNSNSFKQNSGLDNVNGKSSNTYAQRFSQIQESDEYNQDTLHLLALFTGIHCGKDGPWQLQAYISLRVSYLSKKKALFFLYSSSKYSKVDSSQSGLDYKIIFKSITVLIGMEYCNWQDLGYLVTPGNWDGNQKHMDYKLGKSHFLKRQ